MGAVNTTYTFTATDTITSTKMNNIIDETVMTADAVLGGSGGSGGLDIASGKLSISANAITNSRLESNSVTSDKIVDGTIVNADINASAAIAGTKISPSFGNQNISTTRTASDFNSLDLINTSGVQVSLNANGNSEGNLRTVTNHPLTLSTNNTERMRITASGNVGIGTGSPGRQLSLLRGAKSLQMDSDAESTGIAVVRSSGAVALNIGTEDAKPLELITNNTTHLSILSGGNVGIGTTTPSTKLQVNGTVTATEFSGPLTGNVTGNASSATTASTVSNSAITAAKLNGNQSGSAPIYGARAWANIAISPTRSVASQANVASATKIDTTHTQIVFTTDMPYDVYVVTGCAKNDAALDFSTYDHQTTGFKIRHSTETAGRFVQFIVMG